MKVFCPPNRPAPKAGELACPKMLPPPKAGWDCPSPKPGVLCCPKRLPPKAGLEACCPNTPPPVCPKAGVEPPKARPVPKREGVLEAPNAPPVLKVNGEEDAALLAPSPKPGADCCWPKMDPPVPKDELVEPNAGVEAAPNRLGEEAWPNTLAADDCPKAPPKAPPPKGAEACMAQSMHRLGGYSVGRSTGATHSSAQVREHCRRGVPYLAKGRGGGRSECGRGRCAKGRG